MILNESSITDPRVAISAGVLSYPSVPPFHPGQVYPEYPFGKDYISDSPNHVYEGIRRALRALKLDEDRYGTPGWNPLGDIIRPGDRVVLKPNWVINQIWKGQIQDTLTTHGSVIRAILDYVIIALNGKGSVVLFDCPLTVADFDEILKYYHIPDICEFISNNTGIRVIPQDGRFRKILLNEKYRRIRNERDARQATSHCLIDLGEHSLHSKGDMSWKRYESGGDETDIMRQHHNEKKHEYLIFKPALEADVFINIPKMKTHCKTGCTIALKNLIGICADKSYLPHYKKGGSLFGGDEYEGFSPMMEIRQPLVHFFRSKSDSIWNIGLYGWRIIAWARRGFKPKTVSQHGKYDVFGGSWMGNDTLWRTIIDLNRIIFYVDSDGKLHDKPIRKYFCLVDGVIAGDGNGPLKPTPRKAGLIFAGFNPVAVELAGIRAMGFDYRKIRVVTESLKLSKPLLCDFPNKEPRLIGDRLPSIEPFIPPSCWEDLIVNGL